MKDRKRETGTKQTPEKPMRTLLLIFATAVLITVQASPSQAYTADELLEVCQIADNDARWGEVAELECEQYILGFVHALRETGDTTVCAPELNTADEVRWAYMRWVHEDFSMRRAMTASAALLATLREDFPCN